MSGEPTNTKSGGATSTAKAGDGASLPQSKASTADDIAQLVCFLALPQSGQMTGEFVRMDAGMHLIT